MIEHTVENEQFLPSAQQEHLWFLLRDGLTPTAQCVIGIHGGLDLDRLKRAIQAVASRHEILRTQFQSSPGMLIPLQVIQAEPEMRRAHHDLQGLSPDEQNARVEELWRILHNAPFDLDHAQPWTTVLVTLGTDRHLLLVRLPALSADQATMENLVAEIGCNYERGLAGHGLQDEVMQYADFCQWQYEILESEDTAAGREFWDRQQLKALLEVRLSRVESSRDDCLTRVPVELDPNWAAEIAGRPDAEEFLLACWQLLLSRLTGVPNLCVGVLTDGRKFAELRGAFGVFAQLLPVCCRVDEGAAWNEHRRAIQGARQEVYDWQEAFTWRGIRGRADDSEPDFPFSFVFTNLPSPVPAAGLVFTLEQWSVPLGQPEVELLCLRGDGSLTLEIRFDAVRLGHEQAGLLAARLQALIGAALASPDVRVGDLESLTADEKNFLLNEINVTASPYPQECIQEMLTAQASRTPDTCAVISGEEYLTYRQLHERANQLARFLQTNGVGPEVRVGICLGRSPEMLVAMLGVLKAGGAYVPIDPSYPAERLAFMIAEANGPVVLTAQRFQQALAEFVKPLVCLDSDWPRISRENPTPPVALAQPDNLAYVIYTSGSTGRPKGVQISHRNLIHSIRARLNYYQGIESFLLVSSFAFDSSVAGTYATLAQGGRLVLPEEGGERDVPELLDLLERHTISHILTLPSLYSNLLDAAPGRLVALREAIVAGEACPRVLIARHQTNLPGVRLYNEYGPTEGTVWSTVYQFLPGCDEALIGRPIANTHVYLLNGQMRPVMLELPGELFVAGEGLARGYYNRPDLTAERFLPNPFSELEGPGGRLYRTGDRARFRPDGNLEFLGRVDHQLKIRGYRIEPEEIESALRRHPSLHELAVVAREDKASNPSLVAYFVPKSGCMIQNTELRAFAAASLPEYMVPSFFVRLAALPLMPNGKVDRRALPAPSSAQCRDEGTYTAPSTLTEELMVSIWADVLGIEKVGADDNFFESGGHSLLAIQLVSRLRETFRVDVTAMWLFAEPTVRALARRVDLALREGEAADDLPVVRVDRGGEIAPSFAQERLWFLDQLDPGSAAYNCPVAIRLEGELNQGALTQTLSEVVRRHEVLRTTFPSVDGKPAQMIHPSRPLPLPVVDLSELPEPQREMEARLLVREEARRPFDLGRGPLLRARLLRLGEREHLMLLTMHHIVTDGWSTGVLMREVALLYEAYCQGRSSPLPELTLQYADYAQWQRRWLQGEVLASHLTYWKGQLRGALPAQELPTDYVRQAAQSHRRAGLPFRLSRELTLELRQLSQREGVTLFMLLLAAFKTLLYRYTGHTDLLVGTPIANRNREEVKGLVGFFVNMLVLRTDLSGTPSFRELLRRVREVALGAYAYQDLPFERLVKELQPERDLSRSSLIQVVFDFQNSPGQAFHLPNLSLSPLRLEAGTTKFDFVFSLLNAEQGLIGSLDYSRDLFRVETVRRLLGHFERLLNCIAVQLDNKLDELEIMSDAEKALLAQTPHVPESEEHFIFS